MYMQNNNRLILEKSIWQQTAAAGLIIGLIAGLAGVMFPQPVFYETARYYSGNVFPAVGMLFSGDSMRIMDYMKNMQYYEYFAYFLCMRLLIPLAIILAGILRKGSLLLRIYILLELMAYTVQAVLIFGAGGMESFLLMLKLHLLPQSCYLLSAILAFCEKKAGFCSIKQYILIMIKSTLTLCCGAVVEIYLFLGFQQ